MTAFLAMPDEPAAIPGWLDRTLIGADLPRYIAELRLVHRPGPPPALSDVLGPSREAFLEGGFAALPAATQKALLRNPDLLPELAELVFAEGGEHWLGGLLDPLEKARAEKVAANVSAALAAAPRRDAAWRWAERVGWGLAVAAAVFLTVTVTRSGSHPGGDTAAPGWGFNRVAELPRTGDTKAVFARLADLADEWGKKPTADRLSLAKRLTEFRLGCSALQVAELPLPEADARWVRLRCLDWSAAIDRHLRELDEGVDPARVRAADATVAGVARELRDRVG